MAEKIQLAKYSDILKFFDDNGNYFKIGQYGSSIVPVSGGFNLGSESNRWVDLYLSGELKYVTQTGPSSYSDTTTISTNGVTLQNGAVFSDGNDSLTATEIINTINKSNDIYLTKNGNQITLTRPNGTTQSVTDADTDTHYTANLYAGANGATTNATSATSNPYLILRENSTNRNQIQIKGSGATTVSANNGVITIKSTDTDTNTAHSHSVGNGLSITGSGGISGTTTYSAKAGSGITVNSNGINVNTSYTTSGKNYKVQIDSTSGGLYVNVPWENTDTNTDTMVTQNKVITTNGNYPVLLAHSTSNAAITGDVNKTSTLLYNPSTKALSAGSFSGSGASLTSLNADNISSGTVAAARLPNATTSAKGAVKIGTGLSVSSGTVSLGTSGVTAGSYGPQSDYSSTRCPIPYVTVDKYGRITSSVTRYFYPYTYIIEDKENYIISKTPVKADGKMNFYDSSALEEYYDENSYGVLKVYWCDDTLARGENLISEFIFNIHDLISSQDGTQGVLFHVPNGASYNCWVRLFINAADTTEIGCQLLGNGWSNIYDAKNINHNCSIQVNGLRAGCQ